MGSNPTSTNTLVWEPLNLSSDHIMHVLVKKCLVYQPQNNARNETKLNSAQFFEKHSKKGVGSFTFRRLIHDLYKKVVNAKKGYFTIRNLDGVPSPDFSEETRKFPFIFLLLFRAWAWKIFVYRTYFPTASFTLIIYHCWTVCPKIGRSWSKINTRTQEQICMGPAV